MPITEIKEEVLDKVQEETFTPPQYHVILLDDDDHTYDYVLEMLGHVFGYGFMEAYKMALTVDSQGYVIVATTHKDRAELKRDQIKEYGADWRIPRSTVGMKAIVEPAFD